MLALRRTRPAIVTHPPVRPPLGLAGGLAVALGLAAPSCTLERSEPEQPSTIPASVEATPTVGVVSDRPAAPRDAGAVAPPEAPLSQFCGVGSCLPSDEGACEPAAATGLSVVDAGVSASVFPVLDGGLLDGGAADSGPGDGPVASELSCQFALVGESEIERTCRPSGTRQLEESCNNSTDCAPGLACTGMQFSAWCLPVCCADQPGSGPGGGASESCQPGFHCIRRPLREESLGEADGPSVPVCVRAEACNLREESPCEGQGCRCAPDEMCSVVRSSGTTACVERGEGRVGEPCPCAPGHLCSATGACQALCELEAEAGESGCGEGVCEAVSTLGDTGLGVCLPNPGAEALMPL